MISRAAFCWASPPHSLPFPLFCPCPSYSCRDEGQLPVGPPLRRFPTLSNPFQPFSIFRKCPFAVVAIKGNFLMGLNFVVIKLYPMRPGATMVSSLLVNTAIILTMMPAILQFCATAFAVYAVNTDIFDIFAVQVGDSGGRSRAGGGRGGAGRRAGAGERGRQGRWRRRRDLVGLRDGVCGVCSGQRHL